MIKPTVWLEGPVGLGVLATALLQQSKDDADDQDSHLNDTERKSDKESHGFELTCKTCHRCRINLLQGLLSMKKAQKSLSKLVVIVHMRFILINNGKKRLASILL